MLNKTSDSMKHQNLFIQHVYLSNILVVSVYSPSGVSYLSIGGVLTGPERSKGMRLVSNCKGKLQCYQPGENNSVSMASGIWGHAPPAGKKIKSNVKIKKLKKTFCAFRGLYLDKFTVPHVVIYARFPAGRHERP